MEDLLVSFASIYLLGFVLYLYLKAAWEQQGTNRGWPVWRTISFCAGILCLLVAVAPTLLSWAHLSFKGHMVQHLLLAMVAPIGLVMGMPVSLLLRSCTQGQAKRISMLLHSSPVHAFTRPLVALLLNVGVMYLLYLSPVFTWMHESLWLHYLVHLHFFLAGYLFTWVIIGLDPAPRRPGLMSRLIVVFVSIAAHANLCKIMYSYGYPRTGAFSMDDIRAGAELMYYGGDLAALVVVIILFGSWYVKKGRKGYEMRWQFWQS